MTTDNMASGIPTETAAPDDTPVRKAAPSRRPRLRRWMQRLHLVLGLSAGLVAVSMGLSGTVLSFRAEIDRALNPRLYQVQPQTERRSLDELATVAATALPDGEIRKITVSFQPDEALLFTGRQHREAFVDPYTGELLGARDGARTLVGWALHWHQEFGAGEIGNRIVGISAIGLLVVLATGAWLSRPIRRPQIRRPAIRRRSTSWKAAIYASHRQIGLITGAFLFVMAYTGAAFVYRDNLLPIYGALTGTEGVLPVPKVPSPDDRWRVSLDEAMAAALARFPQAAVSALHLPDKPTVPLRIVMRQPGEIHPLGKTLLYIHPADGTILSVVDALTAPVAWRLYYVLNYPLHTGEIGGLPTRLLVLALSPMPAVLFVTGFLIWRNKRRA